MQQSLRELLDKYLSDSLAPQEEEIFRKMLEERGYEGELQTLVEEYILDRSLTGKEDEELKAKSYLRLQSELFRQPQKLQEMGRRAGMSWLRRGSWAAAVIILAGAAAYWWFQGKEDEGAKTATLQNMNAVPVAAKEIRPGGNKAILTLADGSTIILDSAADGTLASQGATRITKTANGELVYTNAEKNKELLMNTISTPAGGQYNITLPDGSKARLNAGSSITFPAAFTGKTRAVSASGEVFLEVTPDQLHPFVVTVNNTAITVLGTAFNINAYKEEPHIRTTLVEGAVVVNAGGQPLKLKPGQQANVQAGSSTITLVQDPNMDQVLAWTKGLFNFEGSDLPAVMRQLEHWYGITVTYAGKLPPITFKGKMYRNVNLADVLEVLQEWGLRFKLEGKELTVSGKDNA
ncbi:MAG: FecR domain-containing protein [Chitinophagaceae bacterium]|nr:FecR domain-containing protein [Chitinophagaceae bacterium]